VKIFIIVSLVLGFIILIVIACGPNKKKKSVEEPAVKVIVDTYNFDKPDKKMTLPKSLREISGLSFYKDNQLACVNDEEGKVFFYDFAEEEIVGKIDFSKAGDYEGIEIVGNIIYVLKSDGKIKVFDIEGEEKNDIDCRNANVIEYEGLGYDSQTNSLLLATKEHIKEKDEQKVIYSYDLRRGIFSDRVIITETMVKGNNGKVDFRPSGIAVHPLNGDIYIIASQGKKLLVLTNQGIKKDLVELNDKLFRQPEGICFAPSGDLYISSEGENKKGYILKFDYNQ